MYDGEVFRYGGALYRRQMARERDHYLVGVDVGKQADFTAIAVVKHSTRGLPTWTTRGSTLAQDVETFFDLVALERLPLQMSYPEQARRVEEIMAHPRLRRADLLVDATGVGQAIADTFSTMALNPIRMTITGGNEAVRHADDKYSVPKLDLVSAVLAKLHSKELRFGADLPLLEPLREELRNFQLLSRTATGHEVFGARQGAHDDLCLALSLPIWFATSAPRRRGEVSAYRMQIY